VWLGAVPHGTDIVSTPRDGWHLSVPAVVRGCARAQARHTNPCPSAVRICRAVAVDGYSPHAGAGPRPRRDRDHVSWQRRFHSVPSRFRAHAVHPLSTAQTAWDAVASACHCWPVGLGVQCVGSTLAASRAFCLNTYLVGLQPNICDTKLQTTLFQDSQV
jgi:hypothetical protein